MIVLFTAACESPTPTVEVELPSIPTPEVPPPSEINGAIERWENSNTTDYFIEVEERNQEERWMIRMVIADKLIRAAQRLDLEAGGSWGEPYSISREEAQGYTVESLFQRIRDDVSGNGVFLFNMITVFDDSLGFPLYAKAEALPSFTEEGTLDLNRQNNYDFTVELKTLMEKTNGIDQQPFFTLTRSNGPEAWCDNLRIFPDGSSIYLDDCRNVFMQIPTPESRLALLDELRSSFASLDDLRVEDGQTQRLIIAGTGVGAPDEDNLEEAWQLSADLQDILSETTGLGLVMSYVNAGDLIGFDVFNKLVLPSQITKNGDIRGAVLTQDGMLLGFSDDDGLNVFDFQSQSTTQLLPPPDNGYYLPRSWSSIGRLLVSLIPENDAEPIQHGWITLEDKTWYDLPTPEGSPGYGCYTGAAWSPEGNELAITGLEYGTPCNTSPGLTRVDTSLNTAQVVIAPMLNPIAEDDSPMIAGTHTPAWSPDGTWITFGLDQDPTEAATFPTRLYRIHPDGGNLTPLTSNSQGFATHPVWAQDGSFYYGLSGAGADVDGLYQYLPAENTRILLSPGTGIHPLSISPDGEFLLYEQGQALKIWQFRLQETVAEISGEEDEYPTFAGWIFIEREQ